MAILDSKLKTVAEIGGCQSILATKTRLLAQIVNVKPSHLAKCAVLGTGPRVSLVSTKVLGGLSSLTYLGCQDRVYFRAKL